MKKRWILLLVLLSVYTLSVGCQTSWSRITGNSDRLLVSREHVRKAVQAAQENDLPGARRFLKMALRAYPENLEAHLLYADVLWQQGETETAITEMEYALQIPGCRSSVNITLAHMLYETQQIELAAHYLERGMKESTADTDSWVLLGRIYQAQGNKEQAQAAFHHALYYAPEHYQAQMCLSDLYLITQRPQRALEVVNGILNEMPETQPSAEVVYRKGLALFHLKRYHEAEENIALACEIGNPNIEALTCLAETQYLVGKYADAEKNASAGLAISPGDARCEEILQKIHAAASGVAQMVPR